MELQRRSVIFINIFLLLNLIYAAEPEDSTITTTTPNVISTTISNIKTSPVDSQHAVTYDTVNTTTTAKSDKDTTPSDDDISDLIPSKIEEEQHLRETDNIPEIPEEKAEEIEDLQHGGRFETIPKTIDEDDPISLPQPVDYNNNVSTSETEWIEEDVEDLLDNIDVPPFVEAMTDKVDSHLQEYIFQSQIGIILAVLLVVLMAMVYTSHVAWRRFIKKRYGSREILVNEDDMIDPNDMKYFSL